MSCTNCCSRSHPFWQQLQAELIEFGQKTEDVVKDVADQIYRLVCTPAGLKTLSNSLKSVFTAGEWAYNSFCPDQDNIWVDLDRNFSPLKKGFNSISLIFLINEWVQDPCKGGGWKIAARVFNTIGAAADLYSLLSYLGVAANVTGSVKIFSVVVTISAETVKNASIVIASLLSLIEASISLAELIQLCQETNGKKPPHWTDFVSPILSIGFSIGKIAVIVFAGPEIYLAYVAISIGTALFSILKQCWTSYLDREKEKKKAELNQLNSEIAQLQKTHLDNQNRPGYNAQEAMANMNELLDRRDILQGADPRTLRRRYSFGSVLSY